MSANKSKHIHVKTVLLSITILIAMLLTIKSTVSDTEKTKYSDIEKEEIDDSSQEVLKEYYGDLVGIANKKDARFNTIAAKDSIAILNVTINGKDRRILTRLNTGTLYSGQTWPTSPYTFTTTNLVVLGNVSLKGFQFSEINNDFGLRRYYSIGSTKVKIIDEGYSRLYNGVANISINPIIRDSIDGYSVFLSPEGLTKGIYVAEKTNSYFAVKSLNPKGNIAFSWMLRGTRKDFENEYLNSYSNLTGIKITAIIDYENQTTQISIVMPASIMPTDNIGLNQSTNQENESNSSMQNLSILTGNIILEEDLSEILEDLPQQLHSVNESPATNESSTTNQTIQPVNNENGHSSAIVFTLYSTDEGYAIEQAAFVSGLSIPEVKKLINFIYKSPVNFGDEIIEEIVQPVQPKIDGIEKVNGSVIIRLG